MRLPLWTAILVSLRGDVEEKEEADAGADVSTPCPLCQQNVEIYQDRINKEFGIPIVVYSQIMAVAFGMDGKKDAAQYDQAGGRENRLALRQTGSGCRRFLPRASAIISGQASMA